MNNGTSEYRWPTWKSLYHTLAITQQLYDINADEQDASLYIISATEANDDQDTARLMTADNRMGNYTLWSNDIECQQKN